MVLSTISTDIRIGMTILGHAAVTQSVAGVVNKGAVIFAQKYGQFEAVDQVLGHLGRLYGRTRPDGQAFQFAVVCQKGPGR